MPVRLKGLLLVDHRCFGLNSRQDSSSESAARSLSAYVFIELKITCHYSMALCL